MLAIPLALGQGPAVIPGLEQERREGDPEVRDPLIRVEGPVGQGDHGGAREHLVDHVRLRTELARGEQGHAHLAVGALVQEAGPLEHRVMDRLAWVVLVRALQDYRVPGNAVGCPGARGGAQGGSGDGGAQEGPASKRHRSHSSRWSPALSSCRWSRAPGAPAGSAVIGPHGADHRTNVYDCRPMIGAQ